MEISYKDKFHKDFFASLRFVKMWFAIFFLRFDLATNCVTFLHTQMCVEILVEHYASTAVYFIFMSKTYNCRS